MMNSFRKTSWLLLFLLLSMQAIAYDKAIMDRLAALPGISKVEPLESEAYQDKYVMLIKQQGLVRLGRPGQSFRKAAQNQNPGNPPSAGLLRCRGRDFLPAF